MHVFLDESGIHLKTGHSVYALVFIEVKELPLIAAKLEDVARKVNVSSLHWKSMAWPVRKQVFDALRRLPFTYQIAVVNNPLTSAAEAIGRDTLARLLRDYDQKITAIYIDGSKPRHYEAGLKKSLRDQGVRTVKLRTVDDRSYVGIQIADLIAGLYRHMLDKPSRESALLQALIANKQK